MGLTLSIRPERTVALLGCRFSSSKLMMGLAYDQSNPRRQEGRSHAPSSLISRKETAETLEDRICAGSAPLMLIVTDGVGHLKKRPIVSNASNCPTFVTGAELRAITVERSCG
jgi:hypothetical protein